MEINTDIMARPLAFYLTSLHKSIFLIQIIDKQIDNKKTFKIAGTVFKIINKGER